MRRSSSLLPGLSACFLAAFIAGCGGGGGGGSSSPGPTSTPRPTATPTPLPGGCSATTYQPNYVTAAGTLRHWAGFPVRVYLGSTDARTRALTIRGFDQWVTATNSKIRYELVSTEAASDISVTFGTYDGGANLGVTTTHFFEGQSTIQHAEIDFSFYAFDARSDAEQVNQSVAAHEFGHALGIGGHSPDRDDLMFASATGGLETVTVRDLNTMLTAYCNSFPARTNAAVRQQQSGRLLKQVIS